MQSSGVPRRRMVAGLVVLVGFLVFAFVSDVRNDPRWLPFLKKIGRSPEQLATIKLDMRPPTR